MKWVKPAVLNIRISPRDAYGVCHHCIHLGLKDSGFVRKIDGQNLRLKVCMHTLVILTHKGKTAPFIVNPHGLCEYFEG